MIKTVILEDGINVVDLSDGQPMAYIAYPFAHVIVKSGSVLVSQTPDVAEGADGTAKTDSSIRMDLTGNKLYMVGSGVVEIHTSISAVPPKQSGKGGDGNAEAAIKLVSLSYTTIQIDTSDWTENSNGGYMCVCNLPASMPYDNFIFDVVLSTDQAEAKLQLEAWNCVIADGMITQTTSDNITTGLTFYSFTDKPGFALTVAVQGVS